MALVVAKFGGTSVGTTERIKAVADRLIARKQAGDDVVAVVSAMGHVTDELVELARQLCPVPPEREMDMLLSTGEQVSIALLAMAIHSCGQQAISFTGMQVGLLTDEVHGKAKITEVRADRVREALTDGRIVIVAGFQGTTADGQITTLGRGGSDTTAVALAAGIGADVCEIYSDVDGVYTADPRIVPSARKITAISYEEMLEMAASGAGVLQMRSVEFARNHGVVIHCRSSFNNEPGTFVKEADETMEQAIISGVTYDTSETKITIRDVPDQPGVAAAVFGKLAETNVNVDMIIQNVSEDAMTDISFTAPADDLPRAKQAVDAVVRDLGAREWSVDEAVAKVSLVGAGMRTHPGIAARMFASLAQAGVNIDMISTSPIRISCVIAADEVARAVRVLHTEFGLDNDEIAAVTAPSGESENRT
ncbi:MAG: aspartate kinase [Actinobacteria bacterium HGW-Actinobacteria-9]|jgi:aspartate kinase|nr:MAG: aspartate kinase [Actinobacteria bacterium HGW-Actinobacteria-9]